LTEELPIVIGKRGLRGKIENPQELNRQGGSVAVRFEHGQTAYVSTDLLEKRADGNYYLPLTVDQLKSTTTQTEKLIVIPVMEEEISVSKQERLRGRIRVTKKVHEEERVVDLPTIEEEIQVNRVARDMIVDQPVDIRREGDTTIIPVMEEVLVVEKRYRLKEEIHITKQRKETHRSEQHMLQKEEVLVERIEEKDIHG